MLIHIKPSRWTKLKFETRDVYINEVTVDETTQTQSLISNTNTSTSVELNQLPVNFKAKPNMAEFQENNQKYLLRLMHPAKTVFGKRLILSGYFAGPIFQVLAYRDQSEGAHGTIRSGSWFGYVIAGLTLTGFAIYFRVTQITTSPGMLIELLMSLCIAIGVYVLYQGLLIIEAIELLKQ